MQGYRTWIGLGITFIGALGLLDKIGMTDAEAGQLADVAMQLVGLLLAAYGNYQAHKRLEEAHSEIKYVTSALSNDYTGTGVTGGVEHLQ